MSKQRVATVSAWLLAFGAVAAALVVGCEAQDSSAPRAHVLQYAGIYYGDAHSTTFDSIELRRDGTCAAIVVGAHHEGRFEEQPAVAGRPTELACTFADETLTVALHAAWSDRYEVSVTRAGATEVLSASTAGTEELCENSGGAWRDDDRDDTGLYCTCPTGKAFIPAAGGCTL